ncbi:RNAse G [Terribacillus aidingensis]|uniref:RNAse G n=1 Tax=Terribacillus aidingensis TaxID=586416 RepID=A0A285NP92_9BACI|nr:ribonuclease E/G [Terribacillus aidingensis]SNZ11332.1 RNAse G [Terribacillus aidingensis]
MLSLYLFFKGTEKVALAVERGQVMEVFLDRPGETSKVGSIYKGIVRYVDKGLQAAFVDFGEERQGFLQRQEITACKQNASLRIEQAIQEGQTLFVQVQKDAHGTKGAKLSAIITLPGQTLVYLPNGQYVAVSKKLPVERAEKWKTHFTELLEPEEGVIVRTEADLLSEAALSDELQRLRNRWRELAANDSTPPAPILHDALIPDQLLRRMPAGAIEEIIVDDGYAARQLRQQFPSFQEKIKWEKEAEMLLPQPLAVLWEQLISPVVHIDRGITLHIEQTEALTVIDVNSAGYKGHSDKQQTAAMVNQLAAKAIAREMRLRNLSGIILIDFVSMNRSEQQRAVLQTFRQALHQDSQRTEIYGFTKLGILEVSRKRERPSIPNQLQKAVKPELSLESRCFQLERDLLNAASDCSYVLSGKKTEIRRFLELTKKPAVSAAVYVRYQDKPAFKLEEIDEATVKRDGLESLDNLF